MRVEQGQSLRVELGLERCGQAPADVGRTEEICTDIAMKIDQSHLRAVDVRGTQLDVEGLPEGRQRAGITSGKRPARPDRARVIAKMLRSVFPRIGGRLNQQHRRRQLLSQLHEETGDQWAGFAARGMKCCQDDIATSNGRIGERPPKLVQESEGRHRFELSGQFV